MIETDAQGNRRESLAGISTVIPRVAVMVSVRWDDYVLPAACRTGVRVGGYVSGTRALLSVGRSSSTKD